MAKTTDTPTETKTRAARTSYETIVRSTRLYINTKLEVLREIDSPSDLAKGEIKALETILVKLGGEAK